MNANDYTRRDVIYKELETTRARFHSLLASLSEKDFQRQSLNSGWTNGEILAHMTFGFIVIDVLLPLARFWGRLPKGSSKWFAWSLNALTGPFNWINALGARLQARVFTPQQIGRVYDWVHFSLLRQLEGVKDNEWERGMYYPTRWDPNFHDFMKIRELFHYPVRHFNFHMAQIAR
jgi:hypothetical protein